MIHSFFEPRHIFAIFILWGFGALFFFLHIPLPWLVGGVIGSFCLSLFRLNIILPKVFRPIIMTLIGFSLGSLVTVETLKEVSINIPLFVGLIVFIPLYMAFSTYAHHKIMRISLTDSFLCSAPGLLSYIIIIAEEKKCNFGLIMLVHGLRLIFLVIIIPLWLMGITPTYTAFVSEFSFHINNLVMISILTAFVLVIGIYLSKLKITAPWLLASVMISAFVSLNFSYKVTPDPIAMTFGQLFLGSLVGGNIKRDSLNQAFSFYIKMIFVFALCLLFVVFSAIILLNFTTVSFATILLAFSPGGLEAMALMAIALNLNPLLVSALHILRMLYLGFLIPFVNKLS